MQQGTMTSEEGGAAVAAAAVAEEDRSTTCGLLGWRPTWLQRLLSQRSFLAVYILVCGVQSMIFSYLTVVLSTVEKHFGLKSKAILTLYFWGHVSQKNTYSQSQWVVTPPTEK